METPELKNDLRIVETLTQEIASDAVLGSEELDPMDKLQRIEQRALAVLDILDVLRLKIESEGIT